MFFTPSAAELREWQIEQYQQLLSKATNAKTITFLSDNLAKFLSC